MIKAHRPGRLLFSVVVVSALYGTSNAALIAEIGIDIAPAFENSPPPTDSAGFSFSAGIPGIIGRLAREVTIGDIGATFEAPPDALSNFAQALARVDAGINIQMHNISYSRPLDQLQSSGWGIIDGRATFNKFVPDITKVAINRVTMTIDSFSFTRFGDDASIGGGHTIRIYGVPEPGLVPLSIVALSGLWLMGYRLSVRR
jgi:hypothetical protein